MAAATSSPGRGATPDSPLGRAPEASRGTARSRPVPGAGGGPRLRRRRYTRRHAGHRARALGIDFWTRSKRAGQKSAAARLLRGPRATEMIVSRHPADAARGPTRLGPAQPGDAKPARVAPPRLRRRRRSTPRPASLPAGAASRDYCLFIAAFCRSFGRNPRRGPHVRPCGPSPAAGGAGAVPPRLFLISRKEFSQPATARLSGRRPRPPAVPRALVSSSLASFSVACVTPLAPCLSAHLSLPCAARRDVCAPRRPTRYRRAS